MRIKLIIYGWTIEQWQTVLAWAGVKDLPAPGITNPNSAPRMLEAKQRWIDSGGPEAGPSGRITL